MTGSNRNLLYLFFASFVLDRRPGTSALAYRRPVGRLPCAGDAAIVRLHLSKQKLEPKKCAWNRWTRGVRAIFALLRAASMIIVMH